MTVHVDERTRAIVLANAHELALRQVDMEFRAEAWKAPAKQADKLQALEERVALVRNATYALLMSPYGEQAAPAPAAPVKPQAAGKPSDQDPAPAEREPGSDDEQDEPDPFK